MDYLADCRTRLAFDLLANTWNGVVVWALRHGPQRPVVLRKRIGGISAKALNETLRRLEHSGLVARRAYREAPPRVEYHLTSLGESLIGPLETLGEWAADHGDEVVAAQERAEISADAGVAQHSRDGQRHPDGDAAVGRGERGSSRPRTRS